MSDFQPDQSFRTVLTVLDIREIDLIVTPADHVAEWAERHGYRVVRATGPDGLPIFEIWRGSEDALTADDAAAGRVTGPGSASGTARPRAVVWVGAGRPHDEPRAPHRRPRGR